MCVYFDQNDEFIHTWPSRKLHITPFYPKKKEIRGILASIGKILAEIQVYLDQMCV